MLLSNSKENTKKIASMLTLLNGLIILINIIILGIAYLYFFDEQKINFSQEIPEKKVTIKTDTNFVRLWYAPSEWRMMKLNDEQQKLVKYGKELIAHTSEYLGPKGSVKQISNGMNCQNCHLNAGTQPWGNNYFAVQANYPKFRERSGSVENQVKRINDCLERSLNGEKLDSTSREMKAILAYIKWVGSDVPKKTTPRGAGIFKLKELKRACDPEKGRVIYQQKCISCHQADGQGILVANGKSYTYPPLWGKNSYNFGAGLYRISNFAGYVKYNMPLGVTFEKPQLTDEEAWDLAAFVNSQSRPMKDLSKDWPYIAGKPFDHPFGPYADPFSEHQHKYGPYKPIKDWKEKNKNLKIKKPLIAKL